MTLDYRTMAPSDWVTLGIIILLCIIICYVLVCRPMVPWRSTQRWRAPRETEAELGEPTKGFIIGCRVAAAVVVLLVVLCVISPFMPAILGR